MARGSSSGLFSCNFILFLLLWDSLGLWDFYVIFGKALFQFWKFVYNFLRHPKHCLGASRHSFKAIGIEGGVNNRRHRAAWAADAADELESSSTEKDSTWESCRTDWSQRRQGRAQGKPQILVFKELEAVSCENELEMAKFEEKGLKSSKPLKMNRETVKVRRCQMKEVKGKPSLGCCLTNKHILESVHWIM